MSDKDQVTVYAEKIAQEVRNKITTLNSRITKLEKELEDCNGRLHVLDLLNNRGRGIVERAYGVELEELLKARDRLEKEIDETKPVVPRYEGFLKAVEGLTK